MTHSDLLRAGATTEVPTAGRISLVDVYNALFESIAATTPELMRECFRLRYQVYCVEKTGFEDPADNPGGLETDIFDTRSLHALLIHRPTGMTAGTVRLILPEPGNLAGSLPFHAICTDPRLADPGFLPVQSTAEFSRFAVSKEFRRRVGDDLYGAPLSPGDAQFDRRRVIPHLTLGLMAAALRMTKGRNLDHICAVVEPALLRLLTRLGIHFEPVGPMVEYHGVRQPCYAKISDLLARIDAERHDVWEVITNRGQYWKAGSVA